jgi:hypothetical protein
MPNLDSGIYINFAHGFYSAAPALCLRYLRCAPRCGDVQAVDDALVGRCAESQESD